MITIAGRDCLSAGEVATMLGRHERQLRQLQTFPWFEVADRLFVVAEDLKRWQARQRRRTRAWNDPRTLACHVEIPE